jgi:hypothetical protein
MVRTSLAALALVVVPLAFAPGCAADDKVTSPHAGGVGSPGGTNTGPTSTGAGGGDEGTGGAGGAGGAAGGSGTTGTGTGTATGGFSPGTGIFDADRMYVIGTLAEGEGGVDVFCDVLDPDAPSGGFPSGWAPAPAATQRNAYVRPIDGRLLYLSGGVVYAFVPDAMGSPPSPADYPKHPLANDLVVPTPGCAPVTAFQVLSAGDAIVHSCGDGWFDEKGQAFPTCPEPGGPLRIDDFGAQLCEGSVIDAGGGAHPREGAPPFVALRARAYGGFWGVAVNAEGRFERWGVEPNGATKLEGVYAPMPDGVTKVNADVPGWVALDSIGNLYRWGTRADAPSFDVVVRFSADTKQADVVYDEATKPLCRLHGFNFVASP